MFYSACFSLSWRMLTRFVARSISFFIRWESWSCVFDRSRKACEPPLTEFDKGFRMARNVA